MYVREIARVDGKPKVVSQIYIGSLARVASLIQGGSKKIKSLKTKKFGALWLAQQADRNIDIASLINDVLPKTEKEKGPSIGEYFLYCTGTGHMITSIALYLL